jgi:glycosyltransferase involved in cell wall biosynthesis
MAAVARGLGCPPVVVHTHDRLPGTRVGRAARWAVLRAAREVVAVSDYAAKTFNEGLARPAATRVYDSVDLARFDPAVVEPAPVRAELGIGPGATVLGHVAQITPWKAQDTSIRALAELRRREIDAHLLLVGGVAFSGWGVRYDNRRFLRELGDVVDALGVRAAVHFLGQRDDVPEVMRACDLLLLPSWDEPFGLVTVEGMALGTPSLVSRTGAGPELVTDGVTGRLLPPGQPAAWAAAVSELVADPARLAQMRERARAAALRFDGETQVDEMLSVYARALDGKTDGRWTPNRVEVGS